MSWLKTLLGGEGVSKPIDAIGNGLDKLFTSDEERLTKQEVLERTKQNPQLWQHTLDLINAKSSVPLVALARPFCVYVSGINFAQLGLGVVWLDKTTIPEWYINASTTGFLGALGLYGLASTVRS